MLIIIATHITSSTGAQQTKTMSDSEQASQVDQLE
jgi:hypothetical protein